MPTVRLIVDAYDQPQPSYDKPEVGTQNIRPTVTRHKGDVFEVTAAELDRLRELRAVEDYKKGDQSPDEALLELAEQQVKRARQEHEHLQKRDGVSKREVELSEQRLGEAERLLDQVKGKSGTPTAKSGQPARDAEAAGQPLETPPRKR